MDNVLLGVAVLPDPVTLEAVLDTTRSLLGHCGSREPVAEPYCLLYQASFAREATPFVLQAVQTIGREQAAIETCLVEFGIQDGHLSWIAARTAWRSFRLLQGTVLAAVAPLRALQSLVAPSRNGDRSALAENFDRYGYRFCAERFVPQLRLAYLGDLTEAASALDDLSPCTQPCRFDRMAVLEMGEAPGSIWPLTEAQLVA